MAGMTDKDKKEADALIKEMMRNEFTHVRKIIPELLKLTSQDKDLSKLSKAVEDTHGPFHKASRALLDALAK
jgi:hypothetical protein